MLSNNIGLLLAVVGGITSPFCKVTVHVVTWFSSTISNGVTSWSPVCNLDPAATVTSTPLRSTVTGAEVVGAVPSRTEPAGTLIAFPTVPLLIRTPETLTFPVPVILKGWSVVILVFDGILSTGANVSVSPFS